MDDPSPLTIITFLRKEQATADGVLFKREKWKKHDVQDSCEVSRANRARVTNGKPPVFICLLLAFCWITRTFSSAFYFCWITRMELKNNHISLICPRVPPNNHPGDPRVVISRTPGSK